MPRLIKRYDNRKLYDTVARRYISLEEIAELIRSGEDVAVADNASGEDLTAETLAKVILEEQTARRGALPPQFLHELLRNGGKLVGSGLGKLNKNLDLLLEASLKRLAPIRETREEMTRLKERLDSLEKAIDRINREGSHGNGSTEGTETRG